MIVTIMQPAYLPWLGYFHRIALSDLFIVLDHVQIDRNSKTGFAHRNKLRTKEGWAWLTVPLKTKGKHGQLYLNELEIADQDFRAKHWGTIRHNYSKAPFFAEHAAALESIYAQPWERLVPLACELMKYQLEALGITTPLRFSSEMAVEGNKDELIVNLCRAAGASAYISGPFGREYLKPEAFAEAGIRLVFHDYVHPTYPQAQGGFEPYMAALDLLLNAGPQSAAILQSGNIDRAAILSGEAVS
jgi:hypothetical protein